MTMNDVNDIVDTMSSKDRKLLGLHGRDKYQTLDEEEKVVKRFIKKIDGVPVSFLDFIGDSTGIAASIGTRSGNKYRHKGYAKAVSEEGKKWLNKHYDEFDQIVWWVKKENVGSIKVAKDMGFTLDESSVLSDDPWIKYQYKQQ